MKKFEIYYADLSPAFGSEQGGLRPVVIVSNDVGNFHAPIVQIAPITSVVTKYRLPTHVYLDCNETGLKSNSIVVCEQIRTIDKKRLTDYVTTIHNKEIQNKINEAIKRSFAL